jgi:hypothetical protein
MIRANTTLLLGLLCTITVACAGEDDTEEWREQANEINDVTCERAYECFPEAVLGMFQQQIPEFGSTAEECKENFRDMNESATQPCQSGQSFHSAEADECINLLSEMTCDEFNASVGTGNEPGPCAAVCS